jgi:hypothetical protein
LCATIQLEIEYDRSARSAILPEVGLVILALSSFGLDIDRGFIGLNVITTQKLLTHRPNDRHERFTDSHHPTTERDSRNLQPGFPLQHRTLSEQRQMITVFVHDRVDDEPVTDQAFGDDARRNRCGLNALSRPNKEF